MKKTKRVLAFLSALIMIISVFSSCKSNPGETDMTVEEYLNSDGKISVNKNSIFKLPCARSDSFNPYFLVTQNNEIVSQLLYDSLFEADNTFDVKDKIAASFTMNATDITVTLKSGVLFSDGSPVTASDVVYSFNLAKKCERYAKQLAVISSASAQDSSTVKFKLSENDPYAKQLLTFPIIKNGSGNTADKNPIGSGKFMLEIKENDYSLVPNKIHGDNPAITTIKLVNVQSKESITNALKIGNLSFAWDDLSSGTHTGSNSKTKRVPLNNFVFIGFNKTNAVLSDKMFRAAVSAAIDREEIASTSYHSFATAAPSIYNPLWKYSAGTDIASKRADEVTAKKMLEKSTYKPSQSFTILVNSENAFRRSAAEQIAKQLNAQGIKATVSAVDFAQYQDRINKGNYDMFIGEIKLTDDMNLNTFFKKEGEMSYLLDLEKLTCDDMYLKYIAGEIPHGEFIISLKDEMPIIPVVYRKGAASYTNMMKVQPECTYGDLFENVSDWTL